jgi:hypothetical protein
MVAVPVCTRHQKFCILLRHFISELVTVLRVTAIVYLLCLHGRDFVTEYFIVVCAIRIEFLCELYMNFSLQRVNGRRVEGGAFDIGAILVAR